MPGLYMVKFSRNDNLFEAKVRVKLIQNNLGFKETTGMEFSGSPGSSAEMNPDTRGILNMTKIIIEFPREKDINFKDLFDFDSFDNNTHIEFLKREGIEILNNLRYVVKNTTNNFWIPFVNPLDMYSLEVYDLDSNRIYYSMGGHPNLFPITIFSELQKMPEIRKILDHYERIPIWKNILLDAINYFTIENFNESIISINIALESFVAEHLYRILVVKGKNHNDARKDILKVFDVGLTDVMKNHFPKIDGRKISSNQFLFKKFQLVRETRAHAIHSFTRRIKRDEALKILFDTLIIMDWIGPKNEILIKSQKENYIYASTIDNSDSIRLNYTFDPAWLLLYSNIFNYPEGLVKDNEGNLHVVDQDGNIKIISRDGDLIKSWGKKGNQKGEFSSPFAIAKSHENLYVTDNEKVQVFNLDGVFVGRVPKDSENRPNSINGIAVNSNNTKIYISEEVSCDIQIMSSDGELIRKIGKQGINSGEFNHPIGLAVSMNNDLYVVDQLNHRIQVFDQYGNFKFSWGKFGQKDGEFNRPHGIFIDDKNMVYVTDFFNNRIQVFDQYGNFKSKIESIRRPRELFVEDDGTIFVSEHYLKTVIKLIPNKGSTLENRSHHVPTIYENLEMDFDIVEFNWRNLIHLVRLHGDIEVIDVWQKIDQEILFDKPLSYANYALDLLITLMEHSIGANESNIVSLIRDKYTKLLIDIVSDIGWTWYEQKTRAKLLLEAIYSKQELLDIIYEILIKIVERTADYEQFINNVSYVINELEIYERAEKEELYRKLEQHDGKNTWNKSKLEVIEKKITCL